MTRLRMVLEGLRYPWAARFPCPGCGAGIPNFEVKVGPGKVFTCPQCGVRLYVSLVHTRLEELGSAVIACAVTLALGVHPWYLWIAVAYVVWVGLGALAGIYGNILFPPKIRRYLPDKPPASHRQDGPDFVGRWRRS